MLLAEFGQLFTKNLKVYAYPALSDDLSHLIVLDNLPVPEGIAFLVKFLVENRFIVPVLNYNEELLSIIPNNVYQMICSQKDGWDEFVPSKLATIIKQRKLFGCQD